MVNLRAKPQQFDPTALDEDEAAITPPAADLLEKVREKFPQVLPAAGGFEVIALQVAEMRGQQQVITYLQTLFNLRSEQ